VSGTNAHVILEQAPATAEDEADSTDDRTRTPIVPVALSARSAEALRAQARRLHAHLLGHEDTRLDDLAHSLLTTRTALEHRAVITAATREALLDDLNALAEDRPASRLTTGKVRKDALSAVLFSGQGSQRSGMGRGL